jgi:ATP-dependent DNA helicase RecQ
VLPPPPTRPRPSSGPNAREDDALAVEIDALAAIAGAAPAIEARLGDAAARLDALRARWRQDPGAFPPGAVERLRAVADALARAATAARGDPGDVLREVFGHPSFRPGQREIVDAVLAGRDCIGVMPTGAGK